MCFIRWVSPVSSVSGPAAVSWTSAPEGDSPGYRWPFFFRTRNSIWWTASARTEVANAIGLKNVTFRHARAEEEKQTFDFVVSRAVMPLADLIKIIRKNISPKQQNALPNGLICLKGGELEHEAMPFKHKTSMHNLNEDFDEEFFQTKKVVYVTI